MALTFVQKGTTQAVGPLSLTLPAASTAGTLLVAELSTADGENSFTPPAGGWIKGPAIGHGNIVRAEQWYLPYNPGGLGNPTALVFGTDAASPARGTLSEWSSTAGTSQSLIGSGTAAAGSGTGLTVTASPPQSAGAVAVANFAAVYGSVQSGSWTGPGAGWTNDQNVAAAQMIAAAWRKSSLTGGFANLIGAVGNDPAIGCPTSIAGFNYANSVIGPLNTVKLFYGGALPSSIAATTVQGGGSPNDLPDGVVPVLCYQTPDTNLTSYVNSITRPVILVWKNECESSSYTYTDFKTIFQRQSNTIRAAGNPNVQVAMVSNGYQYATGVNADAVAGRWIVAPAYVDMYLLDCYMHYDNGGTGYAWPSAGLSNWVQWNNWVSVVAPKGKPMGIGEYGIDSQMSGPPTSDATCAARTARITADAAYLASAFGGGPVSPYPMALWIYWYSNCAQGKLATDLRNQCQFPASETGSVAAWQAGQAASVSATASYSTGAGVNGWAAALGVYGETAAPAPAGPSVTTTSLPAATIGAAYSETLTATGGTAPLDWDITTGALPGGLTLDPGTGIISGTPAADASTSGFTVTVTDANSLTSSAALFITVVTTSPGTVPAPVTPGFPQVIIELGIDAAAPTVPAGTFILDDPAYGKLDTGKLGDTTTWTDITATARSGSITRASTRVQGPLITYQPGTGTMVLKNADGRFDPDNAGSPYAGSLRPMAPFRIRAIYDGTEYRLFAGFTDTWDTPDTNFGPNYSEAGVTATDGFKVLEGVTIPALSDDPADAAGDGETTGARVTRILDAGGWYTDHRRIDTGDITVAGTLFGDTALNLLQATADNEIGALYIDGGGNLVFRNRHAAITDTRSMTPQAVFGDLPGTDHGGLPELPYLAVGRAHDDTQLCNDVQATRQGGKLQRAQDKTSQRTYLFPRSYARDDLILEDDQSVKAWAQWVLSVSLSGDNRFDTLTVTPLRDPALWPHVLGREIGDLITVVRRPPGAGTITKNVFIRGITHTVDVSSGTWQTTWDLQDASKYTGFLILDDTTAGKLDTGKLGF